MKHSGHLNISDELQPLLIIKNIYEYYSDIQPWFEMPVGTLAYIPAVPDRCQLVPALALAGMLDLTFFFKKKKAIEKGMKGRKKRKGRRRKEGRKEEERKEEKEGKKEEKKERGKE